MIQGCGAAAVVDAAVLLPDFCAASAGVGSGRGGMGGGGMGSVAGAAGAELAVVGTFRTGGAGGVATARVGVWQVRAVFFEGAGRTTRGSFVAVGLVVRGIRGGLACARGAVTSLPFSMAERRDSKLSKRSVRRPIPSINILTNAGWSPAMSCCCCVGFTTGSAVVDLGGLKGEGGSSSIWLAGLWMDDEAPPTAAVRVRAKASIVSC